MGEIFRIPTNRMITIESLRKKIQTIPREFRVYVVIGVCTFLLDYFLYLFFLKQGLPMNPSKAVSSAIAVVFNYIFNSRFNFGSKNTMSLVDLLLYMGIYSILIVIHVIINRGFYLVIQEEHVAVFLAMCVSLFINYLSIRKFFAYTKKKNHVIRDR